MLTNLWRGKNLQIDRTSHTQAYKKVCYVDHVKIVHPHLDSAVHRAREEKSVFKHSKAEDTSCVASENVFLLVSCAHSLIRQRDTASPSHTHIRFVAC